MDSHDNDPAVLRLFVYGTLKYGHPNHQRFCQGVSQIEAATVRGRLYDLPVGYPMLVLPRQSALALGSSDSKRDVALQTQWAEAPQRRFGGEGYDWDLIAGEILSFHDAGASLPAIDALEQFKRGGASFYDRVLIWSEAPARTVWVYCAADGRLPAGAVRLRGGWPATNTF